MNKLLSVSIAAYNVEKTLEEVLEPFCNINNKEFIVGSTALVLSAGLMFIDNRFGFLLQCVILAVTIYLFSDIWLPIVRKILKLKGR